MKNYTWWNSAGDIILDLTKQQVETGSAIGDRYEYIRSILPELRKQLENYNDKAIKRSLIETGGWEEEELRNREENNIKLIWCACCDIAAEIGSIKL